MSTDRRSLWLGAATNWLAFAAVMAVSFFLTPYLIRTLGKSRYDVWCVVESVLAYLTLFDLGVAACLVRYVARHHAENDRDGLNRIVSTCLALFMAAGTFALLIGLPVLLSMSGRLSAKTESHEDLFPFLLLMILNLASTLPLSLFPSVLDGLERFTEKSLVRVLVLIVRTVALMLAMQDGGGLIAIGIIYTLSNWLEHGLMLVLCFRYLPDLQISRAYVDRATFRQVRTYSIDAFIAMLSGRISTQTAAVAIGLFLPVGQVTFFVTASRLVDYARSLLRQVTTTLTPGVSAMEARGDLPGIRRLFLTGTRLVMTLVLPVHAGLILFGRPFLTRWVGQEFADGSYAAMVILSPTLTLGIAQSVAARVLYGMGQLRLFARLTMLDAAVNVVLLFTLIGPFGLTGVASAIVIPHVAFCLAVIGYTSRMLGVNVSLYLRQLIVPAVGTGMAIGMWLALGEPAADWLEIGLHIAGGVFVNVLFVFVAFAGSAETIRDRALLIFKKTPRRALLK